MLVDIIIFSITSSSGLPWANLGDSQTGTTKNKTDNQERKECTIFALTKSIMSRK